MSDWNALLLHQDDDVIVTLTALVPGDTIRVAGSERVFPNAVDAIPLAHKMALRPLEAGTHIRKYGSVIGAASQKIEPGAHVHIHNIKSRRAQV